MAPQLDAARSRDLLWSTLLVALALSTSTVTSQDKPPTWVHEHDSGKRDLLGSAGVHIEPDGSCSIVAVTGAISRGASNTQSGALLMVRFDAAGKEVHRLVDHLPGHLSPIVRGVLPTSSGGTTVVGASPSASGNGLSRVFLAARYDAEGQRTWLFHGTGLGSEALAVPAAEDGLHVVGVHRGKLVLLHVDAEGTETRRQKVESEAFDRPLRMIATAEGGFLATIASGRLGEDDALELVCYDADHEILYRIELVTDPHDLYDAWPVRQPDGGVVVALRTASTPVTLIRLDAEGNESWKIEVAADGRTLGLAMDSEGCALLAHGDRDSRAVQLDRVNPDGERLWRIELPEGMRSIQILPSAGTATDLVGIREGQLTAFRLGADGAVTWHGSLAPAEGRRLQRCIASSGPAGLVVLAESDLEEDVWNEDLVLARFAPGE